MKRLHIHLSVKDLQNSIRFYSTLFQVEPTVQKDDYAKWMLDDPRVNLAISTRGAQKGLDHLGIQAEIPEEMEELRARLQEASTRTDAKVVDQGQTVCCYTESDKSWVFDPDGTPWESFHSMGEAQIFGEGDKSEGACCTPTLSGSLGGIPVATASSSGQSSCC